MAGTKAHVAAEKLVPEPASGPAELRTGRQEDYCLRSRARLDLALRAARMGAWHRSFVDDVRHFDDQVCALLGLDPATFDGSEEAFLAAIHPDDRHAIQDGLAKAIAGDGDYEAEYRAVWRDGSVHHIAARGRLVRDEVGTPIGIHGIIWDITDRHGLEAALRQSQELLETAISQSPSGILIATAPDGTLLRANDAAIQIRRGDPSRLLHIDASQHTERWDLRRPDGTPYPPDELPLARALRHGEVTRAEEMILRDLDGSDHWIQVFAAPVRDRDGTTTHAMAVCNDITLQKQTQEEVLHLNAELRSAAATLETRIHERTAELEDAIAELETFSYSISHDLKAPLRAISMHAGILLEDAAGSLSEDAVRRVRMIRESAERLGSLVQHLLAFSHLGRQALCVRAVEPRRLVEDAWACLEAERTGRRVDLVIGDLPPCHADPELLHQVIENLLSNALKFTRERDPARIEVGAERRDGQTVYHVRDNGIGFEMKHADRLFGVFVRLHTDERLEGAGIGLAIVRRIITKHGGQVWAEAQPDAGATMYFTVPD